MDDDVKQATQAVFYDNSHHLKSRWKARFFVTVVMLLMAFFSVILIDFHSLHYWFYSQVMCVVYAVLSIWLSWYVNRGKKQFDVVTARHQVFHWLGFLLAIYLIDLFVHSGIMNTLSASVVTLTILAFSVYLIGVYSDVTFIFISIMLGVFSYSLTYVQAYLSVIMIPVILIAAIIIFFIIHHQRQT